MSTYKPGSPLSTPHLPERGLNRPQLRVSTASVIRIVALPNIGKTCDLSRRTREHQQNGRLAPGSGGSIIEFKVADGRSSSRARKEHERQKIAQHKPAQNRSSRGEVPPCFLLLLGLNHFIQEHL